MFFVRFIMPSKKIFLCGEETKTCPWRYCTTHKHSTINYGLLSIRHAAWSQRILGDETLQETNIEHYSRMTPGCLLFSTSDVKGLLMFHVESVEAFPFDVVVHLCPVNCWFLLWRYLTHVRLYALHMHIKSGFFKMLIAPVSSI